MIAYTCFSGLLTCALTRLTTDDFALETDTLTLIRLRHTEGADLGAHLTEQLLVCAGEDDQRVLVTLRLRLYVDLLRQLEEDVVREAQRELEELTLVGCTITDTYELERLGEAFAHAYHHVVDQGAIETVQRALLALVALTADDDLTFFYRYCDTSVYSLAEFALSPLDSDDTILYRDGHTCGDAHWELTYS